MPRTRHQLRLAMLDAASQARELSMQAKKANDEVWRLALDLVEAGDDIDLDEPLEALEIDEEPNTPPNVVKGSTKTGPRMPWKEHTPPPRTKSDTHRRETTAYSHNILRGETILAHMKKAYKECESDEEREQVVSRMRKLVEQEVFQESDIAEYLSPPPSERTK